eukprot:TRINITY_DN2597_c0_g1_i10.p1 TRINITY_DN2597_c0_g1~~TRINITY_DN2597_c0_g1_i10.p1  ORF type:complete len:925 (-),score=181.40 TRINITY_DN2597_c0_g1_i10:62-2836(-)
MGEYKGSQIFHPYNVVGLYTSGIPFVLKKTGTVHFAIVPVNKTYQIFNCDKLNVVAVGQQFNGRINAVEAHNMLTFVATKKEIHTCLRGKRVSTLTGHTGKVSSLLQFGGCLLSCSKEDKTIKLWNFNNAELLKTIQFPDNYKISVLVHPDTYLNKVLVATKQGSMYLWNLRSEKLVHTFDGWGSGIVSLVQSPVVDVVAVGLKDGRIILHNLKLDKTLFTFRQEGEVTSLSFRTDGHNHLVSGTDVGSLVIWDLDKRCLLSQYRNAHCGPVVSLQFFYREPILLTSGNDNSLKIWIFDQIDGSPRLLRERSGHSKNPTRVSFYGTNTQLLSSGEDKSLRFFCSVNHRVSGELSQGNLQSLANQKEVQMDTLRLPQISHFSFSLVKEKQWDNIITCHRGSKVARTWNKSRNKLGEHLLKSTSKHRTIITAVAISCCGNYAVIGSLAGWIDKYNIQSGLHRGVFSGLGQHESEITGLEVNQLNNILISSSLDGLILFWDFNLHVLRDTIRVGDEKKEGNEPNHTNTKTTTIPITKIVLNKETNLLAVAADDFNIRIYDVDTRTLVRFFSGHKTALTDLLISESSRWLISTSGMDCEVRVWDIPSGRCIDWFCTASPITSMTLSPNSDFLATTHVGDCGIYMWANAMYFSNVFLKPIPSKPSVISLATITLPTPTCEDVDSDDSDSRCGEGREEQKAEKEFDQNLSNIWEDLPSRDQLSPNLLTFSRQPKSVWQTLINLDIIKERNKPIQPPAPPKEAPFFLSTVITAPGKAPIFTPKELPETGSPHNTSRILDFSKVRPKSKFVLLLEQGKKISDYTEVMEHLKTMSPSAIDFELHSLSPQDDGYELKLMLKFFLHQLNTRTNFELLQAFMNVFYKAQWEELQKNLELLGLVQEIAIIHNREWSELCSLFRSNMCLIDYFGDAFT